MIKSIVTLLSQLKLPCQEILPDTKDLYLVEIIKDLEDTLANNGHGAGLAGNQIGYQYKVAIVRSQFGNVNLINPKIIEHGERITSLEGCLSLPGIKLTVGRYESIKIYNNGQIEEYSGALGVIIQHEILHLLGRTILDDKHRSR
jgi:peptide deformylase